MLSWRYWPSLHNTTTILINTHFRSRKTPNRQPNNSTHYYTQQHHSCRTPIQESGIRNLDFSKLHTLPTYLPTYLNPPPPHKCRRKQGICHRLSPFATPSRYPSKKLLSTAAVRGVCLPLPLLVVASPGSTEAKVSSLDLFGVASMVGD